VKANVDIVVASCLAYAAVCSMLPPR